MPKDKLGKNEAKRAAAAGLRELDQEMTEEERQREMHKTVKEHIHKGEDELFEKKLTKEEKKAVMAAKKAERDAKKAAQKALQDKIAARRGGGGDAADEGGGEEGGECGERQSNTSAAGDGEDDGAEAGSSSGAVLQAPPKRGRAGVHSTKKRDHDYLERHDGILVAGPDLPFFQRSGPNAALRKTMQMDIRVNDIRLCAGKQELLFGAVLALNHGRNYGLVGRNGVGKTTLLRSIAEGIIALPSFLNVVHVEQEIEGDELSALETVVRADEEREWLLQVEQALVEGDDALEATLKITLNEVYNRLEEIDSDDAESRAAQLLAGLGFDNDMQGKPTREYSGGWRMRVALAQALYLKPDLLLLDEPTNHLDVHALTWLEVFLSSWERTVLVVSHDRGFLNRTTTATMFVHGKRLRYYGGNYDTFLRVRAEHRVHMSSMAKQNERRQAHLQQFISRFAHGHKKMAKQAQSRMRVLERLQNEPCEVDFDDPYLRLDFPCAGQLPPPCITVNDVSFGYTRDRILYEHCDFGVDCDSRVAIVGPNGAGKSTFLKLLTAEIEPIDGHVGRHSKLVTAKFTQHHIDSMDLEKSAVNHMRGLTAEGVSVEEARKYLGRFGLSGDLALNPIKFLSGGQKSRLAFAELAWRSPHILLLDEPTNHLDLETIEALAMALNHFPGGVVFVSHDERLIEMVADELWVVNRGDGGKPGTVSVWHSSFEAYKEALEEEYRSKMVSNGVVKGQR